MQYIHDDGLISPPLSSREKSAKQAKSTFVTQVVGLALMLAVGVSLLFINPFELLWQTQSTAVGLLPDSYRLSLQYGLALVLLLPLPVLFYFCLRQHMSRPHQWRTHCPDCYSSEIVRQHRRKRDHVFGRILRLPLLRYSCNDCNWLGSRIDHGIL